MNYKNELTKIAEEAFEKAGFDRKYGKVTVSNRPDLCEYQCNGALAAAKEYHMAPIQIAGKVAPYFLENGAFSMAETVAPGFINLNVSTAFLAEFASDMAAQPKFGLTLPEKETIIIDYGGPNVAKPLHIGHLRTAIIGESVKRMLRYLGHEVIGDIHLGDWGLQFGLIIEELKDRRPELVYFDPSYEGAYPSEAPFTLSELEEIYPAASARSKEDEAFMARAHQRTYLLQTGDAATLALWHHIMDLSVSDEKKLYDRLDVHFELWNGESTAAPFVPEVVSRVKAQGLSRLSDGALIVDVMEDSDKREVPPCIILKSDGAALYQTTDLGTILMRMQDYDPDEIIYVTDKRQELHFTQVFRVAKKAAFVKPSTKLVHIGYGTMNGKDGKPFKTRSGGVMRLEYLIAEVEAAVREKMRERYEDEELNEETVRMVALAAIKYGDLSNQAAKDYNFDIDRFASFEGNTGPYILYTIVRIRSILRRAEAEGAFAGALSVLKDCGNSCKQLLKTLAGFTDMMTEAANDLAPHKVCGFIYQLSDAFNSFYHETQILREEDEEKKRGYLALLKLTERVLEDCIFVLGFSAPERM